MSDIGECKECCKQYHGECKEGNKKTCESCKDYLEAYASEVLNETDNFNG